MLEVFTLDKYFPVSIPYEHRLPIRPNKSEILDVHRVRNYASTCEPNVVH